MHVQFFAFLSVPAQYDHLKDQLVQKIEMITQTIFARQVNHTGTEPLPIFVAHAVFPAAAGQDWVKIQVACKDSLLEGQERELAAKAKRLFEFAVPGVDFEVFLNAELRSRTVNPLEGFTVGPLLESQVEDALRFDSHTPAVAR